jgi:prolyl-tRNA editing enzyme YbaK/EbsC (Cys-tRNA(Pro) deacylase)
VHPATLAVIDGLTAAGYPAVVQELPESAHTAALAAAQLDVEVGAIANSLVFEADGSPLLVMTSGAHRVDTRQLEALLGCSEIKRASPEFVRLHTGQPIGGVAPLGHPARLKTIVDVELARFENIWVAAGHPRTVFATTYPVLLSITHGTPTRVA